MLASVDVNILPKGIAGALLQHALRYSCRSRSVVCYASVCFKLIFALVCLSRVLVLPQSCISSQRLPGRWRTLSPSPSQRLPGRFVDGCCALRNGYLVACGWMLCFFYRWMLCHDGFTHPLLASIARMYFSWQA